MGASARRLKMTYWVTAFAFALMMFFFTVMSVYLMVLNAFSDIVVFTVTASAIGIVLLALLHWNLISMVLCKKSFYFFSKYP